MLFRNDIYLYNGMRYRLLFIDNSSDTAWVIQLGDPRRPPERRSYSLLQSLLSEEVVTRVEGDSAHAFRASDKAIDRRNKAWKCIQPIVENPLHYTPETRSLLVTARARELSCSPTTIYDSLYRYWRGGQTIDALIPRFHKCGSSELGRTGKRGRRPRKDRYVVYELDQEDYSKIQEILENEFLNNDYKTLAGAHLRLREAHYSYVDGNGVRYLKPKGEHPTYRQFRSVFKKLYSVSEVIKKRKGEKAFARDFDAKLGTMLDNCAGVGHIYEIDATIGDIFLVARHDRSRIIGKPTLYLIIDRWSRLIVGFYAGLENASWPAAMQAILSIFEDKAALCRKYGVAYDPNDWPAHGLLPQLIFADRAEMLSESSNNIAGGIGGTVVNCPTESPQSKPFVECGFKLAHAPIKEAVRGYEPPDNVKKRRGKAYYLDACLNIDEFNAVILGVIIKHNRHVMKNYPLPLEMLARRVTPTPISLWNDNIQFRTGSLSRFSEEYVRFKLLPRDTATVCPEGIFFKGCYYACEQAIQKGWFVRARQGRFKIPISYDRRLSDAIYIHDENDHQKYFTATLLDRSRRYAGLSFEEVHAIERTHKDFILESEEQNPQLASEFNNFCDAITKPAHAEMKRVSKGRSRKGRRKDTAEDRKVERSIERQQQATPMRSSMKPATRGSSVEGRVAADVIPFPNVTCSTTTAKPVDEQANHTLGRNTETLTLAEKLRRKREELLNDNAD